MFKPPALLCLAAPLAAVATLIFLVFAPLEPGQFLVVLFGVALPLLAVAGYCGYYLAHVLFNAAESEIERIAARDAKLAQKKANIAQGGNYDARP